MYTRDTIKGHSVADLSSKSRFQWDATETMAFYRCLVRDQLTKKLIKTADLEQLRRDLGLCGYPPAVDAIVDTKLRYKLTSCFNNTRPYLGNGYPNWCKRWLDDTWDGDISKPTDVSPNSAYQSASFQTNTPPRLVLEHWVARSPPRPPSLQWMDIDEPSPQGEHMPTEWVPKAVGRDDTSQSVDEEVTELEEYRIASEESHKASEEAAIVEEYRKATKQAAKVEERRKASEDCRKARVEAATVEAAQVEAAKVEERRKAREEATRVEELRKVKEEAAKVEERWKASEERRKASEERRKASEERRKASEERRKARVEAVKAEAAKVEAAKVEAAKVEAAKVKAAKMEAAKMEAARSLAVADQLKQQCEPQFTGPRYSRVPSEVTITSSMIAAAQAEVYKTAPTMSPGSSSVSSPQSWTFKSDEIEAARDKLAAAEREYQNICLMKKKNLAAYDSNVIATGKLASKLACCQVKLENLLEQNS